MKRCPTAEETLGPDKLIPPSLSSVLLKLQLSFQIGVFLRLKELNLQQKDLAKLLDVSPAAVSKMLTAGANLSLKTIAKVAAALGCDFEDLKMIPISKPRYMPLADESKELNSLSMGPIVDEWMNEGTASLYEAKELFCSEREIATEISIEYALIDFVEEEAIRSEKELSLAESEQLSSTEAMREAVAA